ncbi:hypothetical protein FRC01_009545 [Tulasnella sp. 417]|nr:hypothetical protein FRC01_009545 [Tulasnella sp. 417]
MTLQNGVYRIKNLKSGTYFDNSEINREKIHGWDSRPGSGNQEWEVRQQGADSYILRNVASRRYAHASEGRDGTKVKAEDTEKEASHWTIRDAGDNSCNIYLKGTDGVIDLDKGRVENGTSINIRDRTEDQQQRWRFEKVRELGGDSQQPKPQPGYRGACDPGRYWIRNAHSGTALDLSGSNSNDGAAIIGYQVTQGNNQQWDLESGVQGYRLRNIATGTYLSVRPDDKLQDGVLLTGNKNITTEWDVRGDQNGYTLILAGTNFALDLAEGSAKDGAKICLWTSHGKNNQKWLLARA